jgi:predicted  nucleic acid-binding Zn-ribbon protein
MPNTPFVHRRVILWLMLLFFFAAGCRSTYYSLWETLGKEKRHLLQDEVQAARDDQKMASEEFKDALTRVQELTGFQGGELETVYNRLKDDYDDCARRAEIIDDRIQNVAQIAEDLFAEWEAEIGQMSNPAFQADSRRNLAATRTRYQRLHQALVRSRARMDPVLTRLNDYVLYLKHNLNAQAVGALGSEMGTIQADVDKLVRDIQRSIEEADAFLQTLDK